MPQRRSLALAISLLGAACAHRAPAADTVAERPPPVPPPRAPPRRAPVDRQAEARALIDEVVALRGLREKSPIRIHFEDHAGFLAALKRQRERDRLPTDAIEDRATWVAFGFADPRIDPDATVAALLDEQVAGFYDPKIGALYVPAPDPDRPEDDDPEMRRVVLAHEIEHGLQDQNFGIPDMRTLPDDDTRIASGAIYEGEATLVMTAIAARQKQVDFTGFADFAERLVEAGRLQAILGLGSRSQQLMKAPPLLREQLMFPYLHGLVFITTIARAGGFAMVDRVFRRPPVSSEQILHPEKYLAGEAPIPVAAPVPPTGWKVLARGRMGELGVRVALERCLLGNTPRQAARGWGGDAFAVAERSDGRLALAWSTVWDSDEDAAQFERAMRAQQERCPLPQRDAPAAGNLGEGFALRRDHARVAIVRGLIPAQAEPLLASLLALPKAPLAAQRPLGDVRLDSRRSQ